MQPDDCGARGFVLVLRKDRSSRIFMRFADMLNVLPSRRWGSSGIWTGAIACLSGVLLLLSPLPVLGQEPSRKSSSSGAEKSKSADAKDAEKDDDQAPAPAPDVVADPSQTRKVMPIEVFKDPAIEAAPPPRSEEVQTDRRPGTRRITISSRSKTWRGISMWRWTPRSSIAWSATWQQG